MKTTQTTRIYNHLKRRPLTAAQAYAKFGCLRLAARINDLRRQGHDIETETVTQGGKRFARYRLGGVA